MKKRLIGGTVYVFLTYLTIFLNVYLIMIVSFLIIGMYELFKIFKITKPIDGYLVFYFIVFLIGIFSLNLLDMHIGLGSKYLFILVSMIMLNDTFAYILGKRFGKHKITEISPNKTYEGLIGGLIVSLIVFILFISFVDKKYSLTIFSQLNIVISCLIMILVLFFAFFGDLLESKLKRNYNIKDSGTIVYGHGGILDRIDSILVAAPIYLLVLLLYI